MTQQTKSFSNHWVFFSLAIHIVSVLWTENKIYLQNMLRYVKRYWKLLPILSQKRSHGEVWRSFMVIFFGIQNFVFKCFVTIIMVYHRFYGTFKHNSRTSKDVFWLLCPIQLNLAPHRSREGIFTDFLSLIVK